MPFKLLNWIDWETYLGFTGFFLSQVAAENVSLIPYPKELGRLLLK